MPSQWPTGDGKAAKSRGPKKPKAWGKIGLTAPAGPSPDSDRGPALTFFSSSNVLVKSDLFRCAQHYHRLGGCVLPLHRDGSPCVQDWRKWQQETQTLEEVSALPWEEAAGLALVGGAHGWQCLQVGQDSEATGDALLEALDLPDGYPWFFQKGEDASLWFRYREPSAGEERFGNWTRNYAAVPPTRHPSDTATAFQQNIPKEPPRFCSGREVEKAVQSILSDGGEVTAPTGGTDSEAGASSGTENPLLEAAESMLKSQTDGAEDADPEGQVREDGGEGSGSRVEDTDQKSYSQEGVQQPSPDNHPGAFPELKWDTDIDPVKIDWLWEGYIARGMLHMLNGDPGTGKSTLLLTLAAQFSKKKTPDGGTLDKAVNTLYLSAEDQADVTLVPRYRAAVGKKGHLLPIGAANAVDISFPEQTAELQTIIEARDIQFCVIDPLFAFLSPSFQKNSEQDIREVLSGITEVADETGCAFVLVRHFNKKEDLSAVYRGGGSIGITAQARLGFALAPHPERPEQAKVLAWTKNNLSDRSLRTALVFRNQRRSIPKVGEQPTFEYEDEEPWTADELLSARKGSRGRPSTKRDNAEAFLLDTLSNKSVLFNELKATVDGEKNYSMSTLRRAEEGIPVKKEKDSMGRSWWTLLTSEERSRSPGAE
jgi:archaellum biogenesis ATPase FlaH